MSKTLSKKPLAIVLGAAFAMTGAVAQASVFQAAELGSGYMVADAHAKTGEHKCGEAKGDKKAGEHKCGEGKCGEAKGEKAGEHKCGEGKCGEKKAK